MSEVSFVVTSNLWVKLRPELMQQFPVVFDAASNLQSGILDWGVHSETSEGL